MFRNALFGQVGVQVYFQSRWKAYDYSPSTQQFFVQDHFTIRNTPVVDVFLSADIKTVGVFFKMAYVNQFLPQNGYFCHALLRRPAPPPPVRPALAVLQLGT